MGQDYSIVVGKSTRSIALANIRGGRCVVNDKFPRRNSRDQLQPVLPPSPLSSGVTVPILPLHATSATPLLLPRLYSSKLCVEPASRLSTRFMRGGEGQSNAPPRP